MTDMSDVSGSILDKVLENKQAEELVQFDPVQVMKALFSEISEREQDVLTRRFGFTGEDSHTLEVIGKHFGVTRERVRQIETGAIKKLKKLDHLSDLLKGVEQVLNQVLTQHGGIMQEDHLLEVALSHREESEQDRAILVFLMEKLLNEKYDLFHKADKFHRSWKLVAVDEAKIKELVNHLISTVESHGDPIEEELLIQQALEKLGEEVHERILQSHLRISKHLKQNIFGHWGKTKWNTITPKRMNDKVHLVLQNVNEPMHFTEIADKINELNFDHKKAYPATVHNELILDKKYVLVGRGIYALSEWGYKPGVVADVIERVLEEAGVPLAREEIVKRVLEQRIVGKSTVHLALMNKKKFAKEDNGKYMLVNLAS
jgi:hypothetical protein